MLTLELNSEIDRLQQGVNQLFQQSEWKDSARANAPAVNIWAGEEELFVTAELPGIDIQELDLSVNGSQLTIKGNYPQRELQEGEVWIRQERPTYAFVRSLQLPYQVEADKVEASYSNGVLSLRLPRAEAEKPKRIQIKTEA